MMNLSWEDRNFAEILSKVGTVLPWEQYSIIVTVRHDAGIIVSLDINLKGIYTWDTIVDIYIQL